MGAAVSYGIEKSSENRLPPLDGIISLPVLDKPAKICYDSWGVPHMYASTRKDGYRLQGFVTAQHRLFQLVQTHLAIHGKLSSIVGPAGKSIDIFSRTCNFKQLGINDWEYLIKNKNKYESAIDMISCYVEGINAWLTHPKFEKPVELSALILNYDPEFWKESDVMSVGRLLGIKMSVGFDTKMISTLLIQAVGYKNAEWFCFDTEKVYECPYNDTKNEINEFYLQLKDIGKLLEPQNQPIMGIQHSFFKNKTKYISPNQPIETEIDNKQDEKVEEDINKMTTTNVMDLEHGAASNAFVVGGNYTDTGQPILCNDPHLTLNVPNSMFYCHLTVENDENKTENLQWTGVQAVGLPAMCIGHTEYCAMGITLGVCDTTDIFVERFEDEKSNKYQVDNEWKECMTREEIIEIKGEDDYILYIRETHHGPILEPTAFDNGIEKGPYSYLFDTNNKQSEKYCLRYALCATFLKSRNDGIINCPVEVFPNVLDSRNIREAAGHLRRVSFPNLNFILADNSGHYGWTSNGLIPIRPQVNKYNPMLPIPGWLSKYDWKGYIPEDELPRSINPKCGYVVSCNNKMVDDDKYPYYLGFTFAMGFRAKRASELIDKMLMDNKKISMEYLKSVQCDVYDIGAEQFITNIMKTLELNKIIEKHTVVLPKWVQFTMDCVMPKEIRNDISVDVEYYNDKLQREKAIYAWKMLNEWDFEYTEESVGATIYDTFLCVLLRRLIIVGLYRGFSDPLQRIHRDDEEKKNDSNIKMSDNKELLNMAEEFSLNVLRNTYNNVFSGLTCFFYKRIGPALTMLSCKNDENDRCWWIDNFGNRENVLIMTLIDCIDCIEFWSKTKDRNKWNWGALHQIEIFHPVSAKLGPKPFNSEVYPLRGGFYTLNMCRPNCEGIIENPLKVIRSSVPTWRQLIDCSDWSKCKCILPMGNSGQVGSPYYQNQLKMFVDCEYIPMLWNKKDVEENKVHELKCDPFRDIDDDKSDCRIL